MKTAEVHAITSWLVDLQISYENLNSTLDGNSYKFVKMHITGTCFNNWDHHNACFELTLRMHARIYAWELLWEVAS